MTASVAIVFQPLPERVDLVYAVLTSAGLGSLVGSALGAVRGVRAARRARYAERGSLLAASIGLAVFLVVSITQAIT
jgi:hypothetical protein